MNRGVILYKDAIIFKERYKAEGKGLNIAISYIALFISPYIALYNNKI